MKLNELIQKRSDITSQINALLAVELTDETRTQVVDLEKEYDNLTNDMETVKRQAKRAQTITNPVEEVKNDTPSTRYVKALNDYFNTGKVAEEFRGYKNGLILNRDLLTTSDSGLVVKGVEQTLNIAKTPILIDKIGTKKLTGMKNQFDLTAMAQITASFVGETVTVPDASANPTTPVTLAPRRLGAYQYVSQEALDSLNPNVWGDTVQDIEDAWDRAVSSDAITQLFADGIDASTTIAGSNFAIVDANNLQANIPYEMTTPAYLASPAVASKLASTVGLTGVEGPIWKGNIFNGTIQGIPAFSNSAVPANHLALVDAAKITTAYFGPKTILYNPYEKDVEGELKVTVSGQVDSGFGNYRFLSYYADASVA